MEPNRTNIQKWVDDLRSGRFVQGQHYLNAQDRLCCLGVACETAKENGVPLLVERIPQDEEFSYVSYDESTSTLPISVMEWLGFESANQGLVVLMSPRPDQTISLVELNDDNPSLTLSQIADVVEWYFLS